MSKKALSLVLLTLIFFTGCKDRNKPPVDDYPLVTIEMEDGNIIEIELYPHIAPNTVRNFIALIEAGFYDGLTFHRVIPGDIIQGGCPEGTGFGHLGYAIQGEFSANGFANDLRHERGVVSMARQPADYDSADSQFFIVLGNHTDLDGEYAAFGKVTKGIEIADAIAAVENDENSNPLQPQRIKKMTVNTFGHDYGPAKNIGR